MSNTKAIKIHQVQLVSGDRHLTIWANTTKKFKVGNFLTLKNSSEPDVLWEVKEIFAAQPIENLHTDWKVGGLK